MTLAGEEAGEGVPVVLLHGLTATRRYVVMGSRALERAGHRVVAYDARGHGSSSPAPDPTATATASSPPTCSPCSTTRGIERAVLAGASMGAHTIVRFALDHGDRVAGLVRHHAGLHARGRAHRPRPLGRAVATGCARRRGGLRRRVRRPGRAGGVARDGRSRCCTSASPPTSTRRRSPTRCAPSPRSRPFEAWDELARARALPAVVVGEPRRRRSRPSVRGRRALRARRSRARSCVRRSRERRRSRGRAGSSPR